VPITRFCSPLRYPGGKRKLVKFMQIVFEENGLQGRHYVEPYCGGAAVGLALLFGEFTDQIHINDLSRSIYSFWHSILNYTEEFCARIRSVPVDMGEWHRQRRIQEKEATASLFELGFSTFFLNRTNRSGILKGGVIGGLNQRGRWKLDARFNKEDLVRRIQKIARYRDRIKIYNLDAEEFLEDVYPALPANLVYLDPPYYSKGDALYRNWYSEYDHQRIAQQVQRLVGDWIVSYDSVPAILDLYRRCSSLSYSLSYSAQKRVRGREVMFFSERLRLPSPEEWGEIAGSGPVRHWRVGAIQFPLRNLRAY